MADVLHKVVVQKTLTIVVLAADAAEAEANALAYAAKNSAGVTKPSAHFAIQTAIVSVEALE